MIHGGPTCSMATWDIQPGESIGPYRLRMKEADALELGEGWQRESRGQMTLHQLPNVTLFVEGGVVTQIGVHGDADVAGPNGSSVGAPLYELTGKLCVDVFEGVLLFEGVRGLSMDVANLDVAELCEDAYVGGIVELPKAAVLSWIGVDLEDIEPSVASVQLM